MDPTLIGVCLLLCLVLGALVVNGWTDAPGSIATAVAARVMPLSFAVAMAAVFNFLGTYSSMEVAKTVGNGLVDERLIDLPTIAAALCAIIVWGSFAARIGMPLSKSHALIGGLIGAGIAHGGFDAVIWSGLIKVGIGIALAVTVPGILAWCICKLVMRFAAGSNPWRFKRAADVCQIIFAAAVAYAHGKNDGQKFIGIFVLVLQKAEYIPEFRIDAWVILLCASAIACGTLLGGHMIIKTLGSNISRIDSWQGAAASLSAFAVILTASLRGWPMSTTHASATSVVGAGSSRGLGYVNWIYPRRIILAAMITFPACGIVGFVMSTLFGIIHSFFI